MKANQYDLEINQVGFKVSKENHPKAPSKYIDIDSFDSKAL